jgi:hypothetical protein
MPSPEYGWEHQKERARWVPIVKRGGVKCRRASNGTCLAASPYIGPDEPWDLGHPDETCPAPKAPEHRGLCNRPTMRSDRRQARQAEPKRWAL